uniref:CCDC66 domain-containing protein n=1 Tax=Pinguiococcus pyrenoidosus TaxID=172671 RepID=A0A7R9YDT9_9STRA
MPGPKKQDIIPSAEKAGGRGQGIRDLMGGVDPRGAERRRANVLQAQALAAQMKEKEDRRKQEEAEQMRLDAMEEERLRREREEIQREIDEEKRKIEAKKAAAQEKADNARAIREREEERKRREDEERLREMEEDKRIAREQEEQRLRYEQEKQREALLRVRAPLEQHPENANAERPIQPLPSNANIPPKNEAEARNDSGLFGDDPCGLVAPPTGRGMDDTGTQGQHLLQGVAELRSQSSKASHVESKPHAEENRAATAMQKQLQSQQKEIEDLRREASLLRRQMTALAEEKVAPNTSDSTKTESKPRHIALDGMMPLSVSERSFPQPDHPNGQASTNDSRHRDEQLTLWDFEAERETPGEKKLRRLRDAEKALQDALGRAERLSHREPTIDDVAERLDAAEAVRGPVESSRGIRSDAALLLSRPGTGEAGVRIEDHADAADELGIEVRLPLPLRETSRLVFPDGKVQHRPSLSDGRESYDWLSDLRSQFAAPKESPTTSEFDITAVGAEFRSRPDTVEGRDMEFPKFPNPGVDFWTRLATEATEEREERGAEPKVAETDIEANHPELTQRLDSPARPETERESSRGEVAAQIDLAHPSGSPFSPRLSDCTDSFEIESLRAKNHSRTRRFVKGEGHLEDRLDTLLRTGSHAEVGSDEMLQGSQRWAKERT